MRLITKQVPMNFNVFQISCTHWGSMFHHHGGWNRLVELMSKNYEGLPPSANYLIHHGDMIEAVAINDPRWSLTGCEPGAIIPQMTQSRDRLRPIKDKIITILQGNHEEKLESRYGDITEWVCYELGVPYGTYTSIISYVSKKTGELLFKQFATHGHKGLGSVADDIERRKSNMRLSLKRQLKFKAGDTYVMTKGHTHRLFTVEPQPELFLASSDGQSIRQHYTSIQQNASYIPPDLRWYANVGAFFRLYYDDVVNREYGKPLEGARSSYAEKGEYDPLELGFAVLIVRDGKVRNIVEEVVD